MARDLGSDPYRRRNERPRRRWVPALLVIVLTAGGLQAQAARVRTMNLEELSQKAGRIVEGRCVSVEVVEDPLLGPVTLVTFDVDRSIKGSPGPRLTVKLLGRHEPRGMRTGVVGMPRFEPGEELILFLYSDSRLGLTSPVGFGQGKFLKVRDKSGRVVALNAVGNRHLLRELSGEARRRLSLPAGAEETLTAPTPEALIEMIERLAVER